MDEYFSVLLIWRAMRDRAPVRQGSLFLHNFEAANPPYPVTRLHGENPRGIKAFEPR